MEMEVMGEGDATTGAILCWKFSFRNHHDSAPSTPLTHYAIASTFGAGRRTSGPLYARFDSQRIYKMLEENEA